MVSEGNLFMLSSITKIFLTVKIFQLGFVLKVFYVKSLTKQSMSIVISNSLTIVYGEVVSWKTIGVNGVTYKNHSPL